MLAKEGIGVDPNGTALHDSRLSDGDAEAGFLRVSQRVPGGPDRSEDRIEIDPRCQIDGTVEHWKERNALPERVAVDGADERRLHQAPGGWKRHHCPVGLHLRLFDQDDARHHRHEPPGAHRDDHVGVDAPDFLRALVGTPTHPFEVAVQLDADLRRVHGNYPANLEVSWHRIPPRSERCRTQG